MFGDLWTYFRLAWFGCDTTGVWRVERRDTAQRPPVHKMAPPSSLSKELLGPKRQQRWCWSTLEEKTEDGALRFHPSGVPLKSNLRFALVLIMSSWHDLMESSLKPILGTLYYGRETGTRLVHWLAQGHAAIWGASKRTRLFLLATCWCCHFTEVLFSFTWAMVVLHCFRWLEEILQKSLFSLFHLCSKFSSWFDIMLSFIFYVSSPLEFRVVFLLRYCLCCEFSFSTHFDF